VTAIRFVVVLAACSSRSAPAERTPVASAPRDAARGSIDAPVPTVDEDAPPTLAFIAKPGRSLMGHTRASWPLDIPEMPWVRNTFANLSLDSFDGERVTGAIDMYAAPGLDAKQCTVEVLWDSQKKQGVQLRGAPSIEPIDDRIGSRAQWRFRARVDGAPPAVRATAYVFCPNDVMFYSIEMVAPGPNIRDVFCKDLRRDKNRQPGGTLVGNRTFDLAFACGVLVRQRGRDLVDECRGDVLVSLDSIGATGTAPVSGTSVTDEELRRWYGGGSECVRIQLSGSPTFPESARLPYADFVKRAGDRLLDTYTRDGMIHP
jgi:hypothetical protein